jgi:hypothetical protein
MKVIARLLRVEFPDAIYHVTNRGNIRDRWMWVQDRAVAAYVVWCVNPEPLPMIAQGLGYTYSGRVAEACRRVEQAMKVPRLARRNEKLIRSLKI